MNYIEELIKVEKTEAQINKLEWKERKVGCPVCRENLLSSELDELHALKSDHSIYISSKDHSEVVCISEKMRQFQIDMKTLYEKQKKAGGIIDPNENKIIVLNVIKFEYFIYWKVSLLIPGANCITGAWNEILKNLEP